MRNPAWHRDEIILALDLYFDQNRGSLDKKNPKIIELSNLLRSLPLFAQKPDPEKFRNPNGVTLKLSNFLALDPAYSGTGMERGSDLDREIFTRFSNNRDELHSIANQIRQVASNDDLREKVSKVEEDEVSIKESVIEGQIIYKLHKIKERDISIVHAKKKQVLVKNGYLDCEVCTFNFERFYGPFGKGFIECHHRTPLSKFKMEVKTKLEDLALVCSNCHRMLHRNINALTLEELKTKIEYGRA
ncbi:MAG TPA: HNH endonuclease [Chitinophagaceae bacterium]|nr:HNH endonuclease [Chitinophagaceae bacterium]